MTDFLQRFGESRFQDWHADERTHKPIDRAGFRKSSSEDGVQFYVFRRVFKEEICKGYDPTRAARLLHQAGMLERSREAFTVSVVLPGTAKSTRAYLLQPADATQVTQVQDSDLYSLKANDDGGYTGYTGYTGQESTSWDEAESDAENKGHDFKPVRPVRPVRASNDAASEPHRSHTGATDTCVEGDGRDRGVI